MSDAWKCYFQPYNWTENAENQVFTYNLDIIIIKSIVKYVKLKKDHLDNWFQT